MPNGIVKPIKQTQYRLSHPYSGGHDYITWNKIILFGKEFESVSPYFVEGFACKEFLIEYAWGTISFRKQTLNPQMLYEIDKLRIIGSEREPPQIRSRLSISPAPAGFKINGEEQEVFSVKIRDIDASHGDHVEAWNSTELGTNTSVEFWDRDVLDGECGNALAEQNMLTPNPPPEKIAEPLLEELQNARAA